MKTAVFAIFSILKIIVAIGGFYLIISRLIKSKEDDKQRNAHIMMFKVFGVEVVLGILESVLVSFL